jgi:carboxymethylenebutenolidase
MTILTRPEGARPDDFHLSRRRVAAVFFSGYAAAALSAHAEPVNTDDTGLVIQSVTIPSGDFELPAYVARPRGKRHLPTVLVISEVFGVHDYIKDVCRRFAKLGYAAIAPAFFVRVGDPAPLTDMSAVMRIVAKASDQQVMGDITATLKFLKTQPWVDPHRLAVTGFCWGGGVTWLACEEFDAFRAGVAWYGRMIPPADGAGDPARLWPIKLVEQLHAPVLGLYGGKDPLSAGVPAMRTALAAAHKTGSEIIVYPDAAHGFHADYRSSYNAADAKDGWARLLAFFEKNGVGPKG